MRAEQVKAAWKETGQMVSGAAIALMFGIAMVQLFRFSFVNSSGLDSMLLEMAEGLAALAGKAYIVVAPLIGVVGAFISGSATVSTTLFASLQFETATILVITSVDDCCNADCRRCNGQYGMCQQYCCGVYDLWNKRCRRTINSLKCIADVNLLRFDCMHSWRCNIAWGESRTVKLKQGKSR